MKALAIQQGYGHAATRHVHAESSFREGCSTGAFGRARRVDRLWAQHWHQVKPGSIFVSIKGPDQAQRTIFMISGSVRLPYVVRGRLTAIPMEGADFLLLSFGIRRIIVRNSSKSILPGSGTCSAQPRKGNFNGSQPPKTLNPKP